jgi:hypothetical protein
MRKKPDGHEYLGAGVEISGLSGELRLKIERTIELTRFTASDDKVVSTLPSRRRCRGNCRELVVDRLRRRSQHCPPSARNGISRRNIADRLDTRRRWALARHHSSRFLPSLMACRRTLRERYASLLEPTLREPYHPGGMWLIRPDGYTVFSAKAGEWKAGFRLPRPHRTKLLSAGEPDNDRSLK